MESIGSSEEVLLTVESQELTACQHHWLIEKPAGPVSKGACRLCGEEREFQNYVEGSPWGGDVSLETLAGGSRFPSGIDLPRVEGDSTFDEDA